MNPSADNESQQFMHTAKRIAAEALAPNAADVDRHGRFPREAATALKAERMLGAMVPKELGGMGIPLLTIAEATKELGRVCSSAAVAYAMHQIQVACLMRHGTTPYLQDYLREVADKQLLLASATSEAGVGGNVRNSLCFVEPTASGYHFEKQASVVSYGEECDGVLATARRTAESAPTDQVLIAIPRRDFTLEEVSGWNALGFRGTCSKGYVLRADGNPAQIIPDSYGDIAGQTMTPISHILWSHVWLGIATEAVHKARQFTRAESRRKPGETLPSSLRAAELYGELQEMESLVRHTARDYAEVMDDYEALASLRFAIRVNNLKISASRMVVELVNKAMTVVGLAGYREDTPYSMGRLLRDAHGAPVMINNDRLFGSNAQWLRVYKED